MDIIHKKSIKLHFVDNCVWNRGWPVELIIIKKIIIHLSVQILNSIWLSGKITKSDRIGWIPNNKPDIRYTIRLSSILKINLDRKIGNHCNNHLLAVMYQGKIMHSEIFFVSISTNNHNLQCVTVFSIFEA